MTSHLARLHPGPLPEQYRTLLNQMPTKEKKNKHKKKKHRGGDTPAGDDKTDEERREKKKHKKKDHESEVSYIFFVFYILIFNQF